MFRHAWAPGLLGMIAFALIHCGCGHVDDVPPTDTPEEAGARDTPPPDDARDSIDCETYCAIMIQCAEAWGKPPELVRISCEEGCSGRALEAQQQIADCLDWARDCTEVLGCVLS